MPTHALRKSESANRTLRDIIAFVDIADNDGNDISAVQIKRLKLLGIKVSKTFGEQVTHLVWYNGSGTRVAAAVLMGVIVVNTGWIDKFEESRGNVLDSEHQVVSGIQRTEAAAAVLSLSGKRARSAVSLCTTKIDPPKKDGQQGWSMAKRTSKARVTDSSHVCTAVQVEDSLAYIPLPSYREHNTGVLPKQLKAHRRSERICDLDEESESAISVDTKTHESLDEVMNIHPDTPLHIHREDCWPPSRAKSSAERQGCKRTVRDSVKPGPCTPLQTSVPVQQICTESKHTDIRVTVADWTNSIDSLDSSNALKKVLEEVDILARTCNSNSTRSHSDHSKVKVKKRCRSESSPGGVLSSSMTPPTVPASTATASSSSSASAAVHLRAEEDPLGLLCSHLVCPSLSDATVTRSTGLDVRVLFALARGVPIVGPDWVEECTLSKSWADPGPFLCDAIKKRKVLKESRDFFKGRMFFVGASQEPSTKLIATLLQTLGGAVSDCFTTADTVIIGDNTEIDKWSNVEKERPKKRIKLAARRFKQHLGGPDSQSAVLKKLDAFFAMMHKNSVLTWKYICDCVIAGHELRPSCRAGHLVTVATEPAFFKPLIKGKNGKISSDPNPHNHVSSASSITKLKSIEEKKRRDHPSLPISSRDEKERASGKECVQDASAEPGHKRARTVGRPCKIKRLTPKAT